jgi:poly(hydroxyalkanoate) granule-associated protein
MPSTKSKPASTTATPDWMSRIKESSHEVLLAGIGALARARQDGPKSAKGGKSAKSAGADFETLVSEGRKLEPEIKDSLHKAWTDMKEKSRTSMSFKPDGKFKGVFEERVAEALARLGVPSAKEIEALNRKVDRLLKEGGAPTKSPVRKAAAKKAVTKKAVAAKGPVKKAAPKKAVARKAPTRKAAAPTTPATPAAAE